LQGSLVMCLEELKIAIIGGVSDITVIDSEKAFEFSAPESFSKGKNTPPFGGWLLQGKVVLTVCSGQSPIMN